MVRFMKDNKDSLKVENGPMGDSLGHSKRISHITWPNPTNWNDGNLEENKSAI